MLLRISLFIFIISLISCDHYLKTEQATVIPKVHYLIGDVNINGSVVKINQEIKNGDVVETGAESYLEANFGKQSAFRIREDSRVAINLTDQLSLDVQKGKVLNILEKRSSYLVRTPAAVAAVRGTIFFVNVVDDDNSYFCACNGTISIEDFNKHELTRLSSGHHQPAVFNKQNIMNEAGMADHDDLEIFEFMYRLDNAVK
jgi:hypothetical protein